jgi:hypothetical protein
MESQKTFNTHIVDDIHSFTMDIYTPSSDQWFRSDNHYKSGGGAAENQFWTDQVIWTSSDLKATSKGNMEEL